jgi:Domain of unknown function (DUF222)/HNH endonuclease
MFGGEDEAQALLQAGEICRVACERELVSLCAEQSRIAQRVTLLVRHADERGYWRAAGYASSAAWLAHLSHSDYRTAARVASTSEALRRLPALDEAMSSGALSLDQVAAAAQFATPETDAELARVAVGKAPGVISRVAREIVPPKAEDDAALYTRRSLSMTWTAGGRELAFGGRLPLEQGLIFEQAIRSIAKDERAADKKHDAVLDWQQYTADALVTLARNTETPSSGARRSQTTLIVHLSDDTPPILEGAGPISPETAERLCCDARRLAIRPWGRDLVHGRVGRCASYAQLRALYKRSGGHCQYPGCTATRELEAHHIIADECGGETVLDNLILLCSRHHKHLHDRHIQTSGNGKQPTFTDERGRVVGANPPHAPP